MPRRQPPSHETWKNQYSGGADKGISRLLAQNALRHPRCVVYLLEEIAAAHERVGAGAGAKVLVRLQAAASPQS